MRFRHAVGMVLGLAALLALASGMNISAPARPTPIVVTPVPSLPTPTPAEIVRVGVIGRVFNVDPLLAATPAERLASSLLFRGLTRLGPNGTLVPDVASSWETSDNGLIITFHLNPDIHWHDGPLVDADDVVFTVARLQDPASTSPSADDWRRVTVMWVDRYTVQFLLPEPLAGFMSLTTQPLLPAHLLSTVPLAEWSKLPLDLSQVGDGFFRVAAVTDTEVRLERVGPPPGGAPATWEPFHPQPESTPAPAGEPRPQLEAIRLILEPDEEALAGAYAAGRVDIAAGLSPARATSLAAKSGGSAVRYPTTTATVLVPNLRFSDRPLFSVTVREALSEAIDRPGDATAILGGAADPVVTPLSPSWPGWDASSSGTPGFDMNAAAQGLQDAGWQSSADGWHRPGQTGPVTIELLTPDASADPTLPVLAERIAASWRSLGLTVNVVSMSQDLLLQTRLQSGTFDVALLKIDVGLEPDLYPLLVSTESQVGGTNLPGFQSSGVDQLLQSVRSDPDPATRAEEWTVLQATLRRLLPLIPVWFADQVMVVSDRVAGPAGRLIRGSEDTQWDVLRWRLASGTGD